MHPSKHLAVAASALALAAGAAGAQCGSASKTAASCTGASDAQMTHASWSPKGEWAGKPNIVETAAAAGQFNTLLAAAEAAGLAETLMGEGPYTVFAPTDAAFAKLPKGTVESLLEPENKDKLRAVLLYHVVPGRALAEDVVSKKAWTTAMGQRVDITTPHGGAQIDGVSIVKTDIEASNGVIHVIDRVIMPETRTIPEVADAAGSFATLLTAVKTAGLADTLMGEGPYTVFAPTDEAFAKLGTKVQDLLEPENRDTLVKILTSHVVPGRVYADQVAAMHEAETLSGASAPIKTRGESVSIAGAKVIQADIEASNGVIHVIDAVIVPD